MLFSHSTVIYCVGLRNSPSAPRFWSVDPGRRSPGSVHELKIPQRGGHVFLHFLAATVHIYVHENVSKYIYIIYIYISLSLSQGHVHLNIPCWLLPHPQSMKVRIIEKPCQPETCCQEKGGSLCFGWKATIQGSNTASFRWFWWSNQGTAWKKCCKCMRCL